MVAQPTCKVRATRASFEPRELIPLFHRWIQQARLPDHLLIDIADYSHVQNGPGVLLVTHQAYVGVARDGLEYRTRRGESTAPQEGLHRALTAALTACALLEQDLPGQIAFDAADLELGFDDRLHAPNTPETFTALEPALRTLAARLHAERATTIEPLPDARRCFRARMKAAEPLPVATARTRLV